MVIERRVPAVPPGGASFVDARDAARAMVLAMERGKPGERYLVTACNITLRELFGRVARIAGVPAPAIGVPRVLAGVLSSAGPRMGNLQDEPRDGALLLVRERREGGEGARWGARDPNETLAATVRDLRERGVVWPPEATV